MKVNDTFFETLDYSDARTLKKLKRLLYREVPASQLTSALKILKGIDPSSTPAEDRASDVCFTMNFEMISICFFLIWLHRLNSQ